MRAPRARVWRALIEPAEFGNWFGAAARRERSRPGRAGAGRDHPHPIRGPAVGDRGREDGGGAVLLLALASRGRWIRGPRPFEGADDPGRSSAGGGRRRNGAQGGRIRLRPASRRPTGSSVSHEQRGLGRRRSRTSRGMSPAPGNVDRTRRRRSAAGLPRRRSSPRSVTRRACASSRACAAGGAVDRELTAGTEMTRQAVTKHLVVLAEAGLVRSRQSGARAPLAIRAGAARPRPPLPGPHVAVVGRRPGRLKAAVEE